MSPRPSGRSVERIRALNDLLRLLPFRPEVGDTYLTPGVIGLDSRADILRKVQLYDDFTPDNDPHGEHDFGAFDHAGVRYFWKIDYYDLECRFGSPDPSDPTVTRRILTVMRADEY